MAIPRTVDCVHLLKGLGDGVDLIAHDDVVIKVRARPELAHVA